MQKAFIQYDIDSEEFKSIKDIVFADLVARDKIADIYSTRFYPNFIYWLTRADKSAADTKQGHIDKFKKTATLLMLGKNSRNDSVGGIEEVMTVFTTLVACNRDLVEKAFSLNTSEAIKILDDMISFFEKVESKILNQLCLEKISIEQKLVSQKAEMMKIEHDFVEGSLPGRWFDSAMEYAVEDEKFHSLGLVPDDTYNMTLVLRKVFQQMYRIMGNEYPEEINYLLSITGADVSTNNQPNKNQRFKKSY